MLDRTHLRLARRVACPACKQPAGMACIKADGSFLGGNSTNSNPRAHAARWRAAKRGA